MKYLVGSLMVLHFAGLTAPTQAFAEDAKNASSVPDLSKKSRKKKVEMCSECGKPEAECECEGEEHKKTEEAHKEGDDHKH